MKTEKVRIVDIGRGPQIEGHRLTVLDVFYYMNRGYDFDFIHKALPSLTREQFDAVAEYVEDHRGELTKRDRRIDDLHERRMREQHLQGGIFAESPKNLTTEERVASLKSKMDLRRAEKNGARHPD